MIQISDIKVTLTNEKLRDNSKDKVVAIVNVTFDNCLAVRDIRIISRDGVFMLGMPSQKATEPCNECKRRQTVKNNYCGFCGCTLYKSFNTQQYYKDLAYPINSSYRHYIEDKVLEEYNKIVEPKNRLRMRARHADSKPG